MCAAYGYEQRKAREYWQRRYEAENNADIHSNYNVRPTIKAWIVRRRSPNKLIEMPFGIPMPWNPKGMLLNAQSETVTEKRTFSKMFRETRCLVVAEWWFEWKKLPDKSKQPYVFMMKDKEPFAFAGIYNEHGFLILTTKPNKLSADVHNRMPCVLLKENEQEWLNEDKEESQLLDMLHPFPDNRMTKYAVSSLVNKAQNNFKEILLPFKED